MPTANTPVAAGRAIASAIHWQALSTRDRRFDGRFFIGTMTTGAYCRPTCPVPFGRPDHLLWFASAAEAEAAGFRPCRRCSPDTSPGTPAWSGTAAVVSRALRLIASGALDEGDVDKLAARVGIGSRQLRRLFVQHLGVAPVKVATTHRLHFARKLIDETDLPVTSVALSSGFKSVRQFNHAIRTVCGRSPTELRRRRDPSAVVPSGRGLVMRLPYRVPFNWSAMIDFLRPRATPGVELVEEGRYRRTIRVGDAAGAIDVRPDAVEPVLLIRIDLPTSDGLMQVVERARRMFDLGAHPDRIESHLSSDVALRSLLELRPGLRVPGAWDGFEVSVRAVLGEGLLVAGPQPMVRRLVQTFGKPIASSVARLTHLFPQAEDLSDADLSIAGIRGRKAAAVRAIARSVCTRELIFDESRTLEEVVAALQTICGAGESVAHYIAMRAFGEPDAFPSVDTGSVRDQGDAVATSPAAIRQRAERWRPWRAYGAMHLWAARSTRDAE